MSYSPEHSAEQNFRAAFDRLKRGKPQRLPLGTPVTQNNVAKEAGKDTTALKKARYPALVHDIQMWVAEHCGEKSQSRRQLAIAQRKKRSDLHARQAEIIAQRDLALSLLVSSDDQLLHLLREVERGRESTVQPLLAKTKGMKG
ncbi:MAG: hypothetical protein KGI42_11315 [Xanthomonadaceae bacterium]|nr:hypothetical protein [Xanthomonadaceae bacterium]